MMITYMDLWGYLNEEVTQWCNMDQFYQLFGFKKGKFIQSLLVTWLNLNDNSITTEGLHTCNKRATFFCIFLALFFSSFCSFPMYFCLDFVGMKCKCSMCIEVELLTSSIFYLIMSKFRRTGVLVLAACGNTCDVGVVNQAPLSNPCVW